jgi:hypothetical protein
MPQAQYERARPVYCIAVLKNGFRLIEIGIPHLILIPNGFGVQQTEFKPDT